MSLGRIAYEKHASFLDIKIQGSHKGGASHRGPMPWEKLPRTYRARWEEVARAVAVALRPAVPPTRLPDPADRLVVCACGARFIASDKHVCRLEKSA